MGRIYRTRLLECIEQLQKKLNGDSSKAAPPGSEANDKGATEEPNEAHKVEHEKEEDLADKKQPKPLPLTVEPSGMEAIYRDKRRHSFSIVLAASLIALVFGMLARRVFSPAFGSFEEYLLAFTWGVGVYAGTEVLAGLPKGIQAMLQGFASRLPGN